MKQAETMAKIDGELRYIAQAENGSLQNTFRALYTLVRRRDLLIDAALPASQALESSISTFGAHHPAFFPLFDRDFFYPDGRGPREARLRDAGDLRT